MKLKILFVGGTWNDDKGEKSSYVKKFVKEISKYPDTELKFFFNGGNYNELLNIIHTPFSAMKINVIIWIPKIPDHNIKFGEVKKSYPNSILIIGLNNNGTMYSFSELVGKGIESNTDLVIDFNNFNKDIIFARLFDLSQTVYINYSSDIPDITEALINRVKEILTNITQTEE